MKSAAPLAKQCTCVQLTKRQGQKTLELQSKDLNGQHTVALPRQDLEPTDHLATSVTWTLTSSLAKTLTGAK